MSGSLQVLPFRVPGSRTDRRWSRVSCSSGGLIMPDDFEYIARARLEYRDGYRNAYLGELIEPVVYGVQGALREYYGAKEGPPIASTLDHIVAAVAGDRTLTVREEGHATPA